MGMGSSFLMRGAALGAAGGGLSDVAAVRKNEAPNSARKNQHGPLHQTLPITAVRRQERMNSEICTRRTPVPNRTLGIELNPDTAGHRRI
jgi:hypothetical protein